MARPRGGRRRKRKSLKHEFRPDRIYLEGQVVDTLPGTRFKVKVERSEGLEPLLLDCQLKTIFKLKKFKMIRGDKVTVELDPSEDLTRGTIVQVKREYTRPPNQNKK